MQLGGIDNQALVGEAARAVAGAVGAHADAIGTRADAVAPELATSAGRIASPELAALDGVHELARAVRVPHAAHTDAERAAITRFTAPLLDLAWSEQPTMPSSAGVRELAKLAQDPATIVFSPDARARQAILDAWAARVGIDEHALAANDARVEELLRMDAGQLLDDSARREELCVLLALGAGETVVPRALDDAWTARQLADGFGWSNHFNEPRVRRLLEDTQVLGIPERRAAFDAAVERAAADGTPFPASASASIELLMSDAAGWSGRTTDERLRLLDALSTPGEVPVTAYSRFASQFSVGGHNFDILTTHLDRQLDAVAAGTAPMPHGIEPYWLVKTPGWDARPAAERHAILDAFADRVGEPALVRIARDRLAYLVERGLTAGELTKLRHDLVAPLTAAATAERLPPWVRFVDVLALGDELGDARTPLLERLLAQHQLNTPDGAGTYLAMSRDRLVRPSATDIPGAAQVRAQALDLIERNLGRINGTVSGGYGNHPDYAEVGRVQAIVDLLDQFERAALTADAPQASATPAEILSW